MKRDGTDFGRPRDPRNKRPQRQGGSAEAGPRAANDRPRASGAPERGHSGYGSESVRPHLRAQLRMKDILDAPFLPPRPWDIPPE